MIKIRNFLKIIILSLTFISINKYCYADVMVGLEDDYALNTSAISFFIGIISIVIFLILLSTFILKALVRKIKNNKNENNDDSKDNGNKMLDFLVIAVCSIILFYICSLEASSNNALILLGIRILSILYLIFLISFILRNKKVIDKKGNLIIKTIFILALIIMILVTICEVNTPKKQTGGMHGLSTSEILKFNANFEKYQGKQDGYSIKNLIQFLIENAKTYEDEPRFVPSIYVNKIAENNNNVFKITYKLEPDDNTYEGRKKYINELTKMSNDIELEHLYRVILSTDTKGMVNQIDINYDVNDFDVYNIIYDENNETNEINDGDINVVIEN